MELIVYVMVSVLEQGSQDDIRQRQLTIQPRYHTESDTELPVTSMWHVRNPLQPSFNWPSYSHLTALLQPSHPLTAVSQPPSSHLTAL